MGKPARIMKEVRFPHIDVNSIFGMNLIASINMEVIHKGLLF